MAPDAGTASIQGHSVITNLPAARKRLGYCPQFSALPGGLTGREVLRMYARIRGVPVGLIEASIQSLLDRLDLVPYADRLVSYSSLLSPFSFTKRHKLYSSLLSKKDICCRLLGSIQSLLDRLDLVPYADRLLFYLLGQ